MPKILSTSANACLAGVLLIHVFIAFPARLPAESTVKAWEEPLVLPTYLTAPPDSYPIFYSGRAYQGAKGIDKQRIRRLNERFVVEPDLVFVLDVKAGRGLERISQRKNKDLLFERQDYLEAVRKNFLSLSGNHIFHIIKVERLNFETVKGTANDLVQAIELFLITELNFTEFKHDGNVKLNKHLVVQIFNKAIGVILTFLALHCLDPMGIKHR